MTISALLLARQFYDLQPSMRLRYATLGLLFVNVSIGGTLTQFAAPPVPMVARPWGWDIPFMLVNFGWRAVAAIAVFTLLYFVLFRHELRVLAGRPAVADVEEPDEDATGALSITVVARGRPLGVHGLDGVQRPLSGAVSRGFLFFLGFARATAPYQSRIELKTPLLVGFFLGGLVIHGGFKDGGYPCLSRLPETPLFLGATALTAVNDNALITYLATLVPDLGDELRLAVVRGAVVGGGLTVIANALNPAGQALLGRFFEGEFCRSDFSAPPWFQPS